MAKHKYIETPEKMCIDCNCQILGKKSNNTKRCAKCLRKKHLNINKIIQRTKKIKNIKDIVLWVYNYRCAICEWQLSKELITFNNKKQVSFGCEIHHINSVSNGGGDNLDNLILLCPNHHKQADCGVISINEIKKHQKKYNESDLDDYKLGKKVESAELIDELF